MPVTPWGTLDSSGAVKAQLLRMAKARDVRSISKETGGEEGVSGLTCRVGVMAKKGQRVELQGWWNELRMHGGLALPTMSPARLLARPDVAFISNSRYVPL